MDHFKQAVAVIFLLLAVVFHVAAVDYERMQNAMLQRFGQSGLGSLREWQKLMQDTATASDTNKLAAVNDFFNRRMRFQDDQVIWGQSDYWATPIEALGKSAGDCEDFAIAKYFTLLLLNIPDDKLRLIYVQARLGGANSSISQAHMVLAFYAEPAAIPVVLDNLINDVQLASRRTDLVPVFSFNSSGLWQGVSQTRGAGGPGNLTRWQELLRRSRAEGFDGIVPEDLTKK